MKLLNTDGGAIKVHEHSVIHMASVQFVNNTAGSGGGAVMVLDHSELQDTGSIYIQNLARGFGEYPSTFVTLQEWFRLTFAFFLFCINFIDLDDLAEFNKKTVKLRLIHIVWCNFFLNATVIYFISWSGLCGGLCKCSDGVTVTNKFVTDIDIVKTIYSLNYDIIGLNFHSSKTSKKLKLKLS